MPLKFARGFLFVSMLLAATYILPKPQSEAPRMKNPHGTLEIQCQNCHALSTWKPIRKVPDFNHDTQTRYPLEGQHRTVGCVSCHVKAVFTDVGRTCASCHADLHRRQFGSSCESCHTAKSWNAPTRSVPQHVNRFPLVGAHASLQCDNCHSGAAAGTFTALSTACVSCHASDVNNARTFDHKASGISTNCESCHTMTGWQGARFDHSTSRFPLTGAHTRIMCAACHANDQFAGTPQNCASCHSMAFAQATNPSHTAAGFPQDCTLCHATSSWRPASFDHARTRFPLTGAHTTTMCATCHASGQFAALDTSCVSCHLNQFNATTSPNHMAAAIPRDCQVCHSTVQWRGATFDHSRTRFALTGAHTTVMCANCHVGGRYAGTPMDCFSCHSKEFSSVSNPNHVAAGFPKTCETCHTTTTWVGARIHSQVPDL